MSLSSLSGRVDTLESQVVQLFQQLLLRIDIETLGAYQRTINTQMDSFSTSNSLYDTRLDTLEGLYSQLTYNYNKHVEVFTGHTGTATGVGGAHSYIA